MRNLRGIFVTGTGTDVGKTYVSAFLTHICAAAGLRTVYYKPIQCGPADFNGEMLAGGDSDVVSRLGNPSTDISKPSYNLEHPASPHLALNLENVRFSMDKVRDDLMHLRKDHDFIVVEGAGGLRVPIDDRLDMRELARESHFPVLVVAQPGLGTLNHTLLTLESLSHARIPVAGFVFSIGNNGWDWKNNMIVKDNIRTLERLGHVQFMGFVPYYSKEEWTNPEFLQQHPLYKWASSR